MNIRRDRYLQELIDRMGNRMIKIVTGLRRVGKSYLLFHIFTDYLKTSGVDDAHIISMDMDNLENSEFRNPLTLLSYIKAKITDKKMHYILLDEVQMIENFEELLNTLLHIENADVYVTGSNSKFLSRDVITEFRGRGDEVHLYPLSFAEFMSVYQGNRYDGWKEYMTFGGLPFVLSRKTPQQKSEYLKTLFTETYLKDILARNNFHRNGNLDTLLDILSSSVGSLTNPLRIANTFKTVSKEDISANTVSKYLAALEDSFLITGVKRYNIRGRHYIGSPLKYYFEDVGLRNARLNFRQQEENYIMENIIYLELRRRGFDVDVGVVEKSVRDDNGKVVRKQLEIDFVANKGYKRFYVQSAFSFHDPDKIAQEEASLLSIDDSFQRVIVVGDSFGTKYMNNNGFLITGLLDFLLDEETVN
ncbi:MAG TPA: ATP-binding protein [Methanocorpusculum sp.]|nr:ATP-binding protein [Methanocorpusculum sp.]